MFDDLWGELTRSLMPVFADYRSRLPSLHVSEKTDKTLLTEADLAVEALIIESIRAFDPAAIIIAEESGQSSPRNDSDVSDARQWVIDPIDGTAEFVRPGHREFCSVICVLEMREPVAAFILAPELGRQGEPLTIQVNRSEGLVQLNGQRVANRPGHDRQDRGPHASVTRSSHSPARHFEKELMRAGYELKTATTSQTLDMVRTAVDIASVSHDALAPFHLFYRENQKIWDGLAGLCVGLTMGLAATDRTGSDRLPVSPKILQQAEPVFDSTLMGAREAVQWFLETTHADT